MRATFGTLVNARVNHFRNTGKNKKYMSQGLEIKKCLLKKLIAICIYLIYEYVFLRHPYSLCRNVAKCQPEQRRTIVEITKCVAKDIRYDDCIQFYINKLSIVLTFESLSNSY